MCHLHPRSIRALDGSELCCCYFLNELYELSSPEHGIDEFFPFFSHDCFSQYSYSVLCLIYCLNMIRAYIKYMHQH